MFSAGEARCDRWQDLAHAAQTLVAQSSSGASTKETLAKVEALLAPLGVLETFRAYPGEAMMSALKEALGRSDYSSFSRLTNRIAKAIITGSYRRSANAWKLGEEGETELNDRLLKDYFDTGDLTKPYFEVLIVSDDPTPEQVRQGRAELRQLRRPEDPFVYETVTVPSFEEGVIGVVMNADVQAVVIRDNFRFKSQFDAPLLRTYLEQHLSLEPGSLEPKDYGVALARAIGKIRPELDVYLIVDGAAEKMASHLDSKNIRRIFYGLEDLMEIHLALMEGVNQRTTHRISITSKNTRAVRSAHSTLFRLPEASPFSTPTGFETSATFMEPTSFWLNLPPRPVVWIRCSNRQATSGLPSKRQHGPLDAESCFSERMALQPRTRSPCRPLSARGTSCWWTGTATSPTTMVWCFPVASRYMSRPIR